MKLHAPAAERNAQPILDALRTVLPRGGLVLEVASGTGQHVATFAAALPGLRFQPTEFDAAKFASIEAWTSGLTNVAPPVHLDVTTQPWPAESPDAIFCANMIHIAPPEATEGLLKGAASVLSARGVLVLYGPFRVGGEHTAPSNAAFDQALQAQDSRWGVRNLDDVQARSEALGLAFERTIEMPANNKIVVFRRAK